MNTQDVLYIVQQFALFTTDNMFLPFEAGLVVIVAIAFIHKVYRGVYR